jgi:hypothetical protein
MDNCAYCGATQPEGKYARLGRRIAEMHRATDFTGIEQSIEKARRAPTVQSAMECAAVMMDRLMPIMKIIGEEMR